MATRARNKPTELQRLAKTGGTFDVTSVAEKVVDFYSFDITTACRVARLEINGDTTIDVKDAYMDNTAANLGLGTIVSKGDDYFSAITISSGAVRLNLF